MKLAEVILDRIARSKEEKADAFALRLVNMDAEAKKTRASVQPALFIRRPRQVA